MAVAGPGQALNTPPLRRIVTHRAPDADAIVSAYLAERYLFAGQPCEIVFVSRTTGRNGSALSGADCVVDVGNEYDPVRLRFDHKPPAFADRNEKCATVLVWEYLLGAGHDIAPLAALVAVVHQGDHNPPAPVTPELRASRESGVHRQVAEARRNFPGDERAQYRALRAWLDGQTAAVATEGTASRPPTHVAERSFVVTFSAIDLPGAE